MKAARALVLLAAACASIPAWAQMYKCVDKQGVTHYADSPLPGCKGKEVDIRPLPSISGEIKARCRSLRRRRASTSRASASTCPTKCASSSWRG